MLSYKSFRVGQSHKCLELTCIRIIIIHNWLDAPWGLPIPHVKVQELRERERFDSGEPVLIRV